MHPALATDEPMPFRLSGGAPPADPVNAADIHMRASIEDGSRRLHERTAAMFARVGGGDVWVGAVLCGMRA